MNKVERVTTKLLNSPAGILLFLVSMAAFYLPYELRIIPVIAQYLVPVRYVCAGLLLLSWFFLYCSSFTLFRGNWALLAACGFAGVLIFTTYEQRGDLEGALGTYGLAGIFLVMTIAVFFRVNPRKYLLLAFFLLLAANIANIYTVYHYWGVGMWEAYGLYRNIFYTLVGNYNGGIEYILPMAICGSAYAHRYGKWLDFINYPAMIASLIMAFKCESETQIIVFAGILAFMILGNLAMLWKSFARFLRAVLQPVIFVGIDFAGFILVVLLNKTNWVERIGMDPNFHNRRHVWNMSIGWIQESPIWGNGQETVAVEASKITGYAHSHSTYLEIAYKTGFVGSVFLLLMLAAVIVAIYRNRHHRTAFMMTAMLFLMGLACIVETYPMVYVMLCLGLLYYIAKNTQDPDAAAIKRIRRMKPAREPDPEMDFDQVGQKVGEAQDTETGDSAYASRKKIIDYPLKSRESIIVSLKPILVKKGVIIMKYGKSIETWGMVITILGIVAGVALVIIKVLTEKDTTLVIANIFYAAIIIISAFFIGVLIKGFGNLIMDTAQSKEYLAKLDEQLLSLSKKKEKTEESNI